MPQLAREVMIGGMTPHQIVFADVRNKTLRLLEKADPASLLWAPAGTRNHILWHAGHALWVVDLLCVQPLTGQSELPAEWAEKFGANAIPPDQTTDWPTVEALTEQLRAQEKRVLDLLGTATPAQLSAPPRPGHPSTIEKWALHGFHDEANHQGEMYLLMKLWKLQ